MAWSGHSFKIYLRKFLKIFQSRFICCPYCVEGESHSQNDINLRKILLGVNIESCQPKRYSLSYTVCVEKNFQIFTHVQHDYRR